MLYCSSIITANCQWNATIISVTSNYFFIPLCFIPQNSKTLPRNNMKYYEIIKTEQAIHVINYLSYHQLKHFNSESKSWNLYTARHYVRHFVVLLIFIKLLTRKRQRLLSFDFNISKSFSNYASDITISIVV